jgi:hypothetical protein
MKNVAACLLRSTNSPLWIVASNTPWLYRWTASKFGCRLRTLQRVALGFRLSSKALALQLIVHTLAMQAEWSREVESTVSRLSLAKNIH